jgi:CRISPR/Cas system-associated exonuclease Cas4 (RecB family)
MNHDLELTAAALAFHENFNPKDFELVYVDIYTKRQIVSYRNNKDFEMLKKTVIGVVHCLQNNICCVSPSKVCYHCEYRDVCSENFQ